MIGGDFGRTAMGGHLADASTGTCTAPTSVAQTVCACDEEMRSLGIDTINCPAHGLIAFCRNLTDPGHSVRV